MEYLDFEKLVKEGIDLIPKNILEKLNNIEICIEETPSDKQRKELKIKKNEFLFGLYEGIPKTERWDYGLVLPDKITIFKREIEKYSNKKNEIREIVKETVWHEIAHHFGIDEKEVEELSRTRKIK